MNWTNPNYTIVDKSEYNPFKIVHLIFFNKNDDGISFLLVKTDKDRSYQELKDTQRQYEPTLIFTAARLIINQFSSLLSIKNIENAIKEQSIDISNINKEDLHYLALWKNNVYNEWLNIIIKNSIQYDDVYQKLVLFIPIPKFDEQIFNELYAKIQKDLILNWVKKIDILTNNEIDPETKSLYSSICFESHIERSIKNKDDKDIYIILSCKPSQHPFDKDNLHLSAIITGLYRRNNEIWLHYNTAHSQFPCDDLLTRAKALIFPGSAASVYGDDEWLKKTINWINDIDKRYSNLKILGICFGAQLLSESLGGKVEKMKNLDSNKERFFIAGHEMLNVRQEFFELPFVKKSKIKNQDNLIIVQSHGDKITKLSDKFVCYAGSKNCEIELFVSKCGRYFGLQGHPEYSATYMSSRKAAIKAHKNIITCKEKINELVEKIIKKKYINEASEYEMRSLCYSFLKGTNATKDNLLYDIRKLPVCLSGATSDEDMINDDYDDNKLDSLKKIH